MRDCAGALSVDVSPLWLEVREQLALGDCLAIVPVVEDGAGELLHYTFQPDEIERRFALGGDRAAAIFAVGAQIRGHIEADHAGYELPEHHV